MANYIQSVLFEKTIYDLLSAKSWLFNHEFSTKFLSETDKFWRFQQHDPTRFTKFKTVRPKRGIQVILAEI